MSISFTNGDPNKDPTNPAQQKKQPEKDPAKDFKRKQLQKKQLEIQKQLKKLEKTSITKPLRDLATILAADPNDDPQELFRQIRPLLSKMGLANMADASKTELVPGKTKGKDSLYKVVLRRGAQITTDEIERLKRQDKAVETIQWSAQAIELYVWYPYEAPEEATPPGAPTAPGDTWGSRMISILRVIRAFQKEAFDYSSVQCNMPADLAEEIIAWGRKNIPDEDLAAKGREDDIHVTLKYGLHDHDPFELREMLSKFGPIKITLGETSIFTGDDFDVVKISVISPELCRLNALISDNFDHTDTHPQYVPHLTIAYVKPGSGQKYQGRKDFAGRKIKINTVLFSGNDNRRTELTLTTS